MLARRLVERGFPYITINYKGWDTHKQHFQEMRRKLPELDKGMAALLQDLSERGLLDSTIVWWSGEFGRTPKIDWKPPWDGGRHHYGRVFSAVVAGGGRLKQLSLDRPSLDSIYTRYFQNPQEARDAA